MLELAVTNVISYSVAIVIALWAIFVLAKVGFEGIFA